MFWGGKEIMKKKFLIGSILAVAIILLASFTPAIVAKDIKTEKMVTIKTTYYNFINKEEIIRKFTQEEAEKIKEILEEYRQSLIKKDEESIEKYESLLKDKGIFGENHKIISNKDIKNRILERFISSKLNEPIEPSIENRMCTVNARGSGNLSFLFDEAFGSLAAAGVLLLLLCAILPPVAVILGLPALFLLFSGLAGLVITHLIPFRILYSKLHMQLNSGDLSINGLDGLQEFTGPVTANFYWFTGLTINIFTTNPTVTLLGFAFRSEVL